MSSLTEILGRGGSAGGSVDSLLAALCNTSNAISSTSDITIGTTAASIGSGVSRTIPAAGLIVLGISQWRLTSSGTTYVFPGIMVNSVDYPICDTAIPSLSPLTLSASAAQTVETRGGFFPSIGQFNEIIKGLVPNLFAFDIAASGIATGAQTITARIIRATSGADGTLKGTVLTTRLAVAVFDQSTGLWS